MNKKVIVAIVSVFILSLFTWGNDNHVYAKENIGYTGGGVTQLLNQ